MIGTKTWVKLRRVIIVYVLDDDLVYEPGATVSFIQFYSAFNNMSKYLLIVSMLVKILN